jgi:hypothetical protein
MKIIPLSEAKTHLGRYARLCQTEPVIVTVKGVPLFQLAPLDDEDGLVDQLLEENPEFRQLLESRIKEKSLSAKEVARRL